MSENITSNEAEKSEFVLDEETILPGNELAEEPVIEEPAIAADIEKQNVAAEQAGTVRSTNGTSIQGSNRDSRRGSKVKIRDNHRIGTLSENLSLDIDLRTKEEIEEEEWADISRHARTQGIYWGVVKAVQEVKNYKDLEVITTVYGHVVRIPEHAFLTLNRLEKDRYYSSQTPDVKKLMRKRYLESYIGAEIPFILNLAHREREYDENSIRGYYYKYTLGGSRKAAMEIIQDYWFFHEKVKYSRPVEEVTAGTVFDNVRVLTASERGITVEICGVETYIERFELITTKYLETASKMYSPGDRISVMVTRVHVNKDDQSLPPVVIKASVRRMFEEEGKEHYDVIAEGSLQRGTVNRMSASGKYVILLDLGVVCIVSKDEVEGRVPLDRGQRVHVRIRKKYDENQTVTGRVVFH